MSSGTITYTCRLMPETVVRIRLLSLALRQPAGKIIDLLVESLWDEKSNVVSSVIPENTVRYEARRILDRMSIK